MDRTRMGAALAAALALCATAALAQEPRSATQSEPPAEAATTPAFAGNPCQVGPGSGYDQAELSALDEWQGAGTTLAGDRQALAYGVSMASQPSAQPVSVGPTEPGPTLREQRQRLFALGLAVLLNLNQAR